MRRYIDFRGDGWDERTDSRMRAARWSACLDGLSDEPPLDGVIDGYPEDLLLELAEEGWVALDALPKGRAMRRRLRGAVLGALADDADCLSLHEHALAERMLAGDGEATLQTVAQIEAAYSLRMRMWCDVGLAGGAPAVRMDPRLARALPDILMRPEHRERRKRVFVFTGMLNGLLYIAGYLDDRLPRARFIQDVLQEAPGPHTERLARNFIESSFDTYPLGGCNLLVHEALADPEALLTPLAAHGALQLPETSPGQMFASMHGLLPEEAAPAETLQRALYGALRPEWGLDEAARDLRLLAKQDAPMDTLREIMASMLCVLPTPHMQSALRDMRRSTPRWVYRGATPPPGAQDGTLGLLH